MSNRAFLWLAILAIALGGALGGILIIVLDDTGEDPTPIASIAGPTGTGDGPAFQRLSELTQRMEEGDPEDMEELGELVAQFPGNPGGGPLAGIGDGGPRMIGTIEALEGDILSLNTPVGPLQTTVGDDTTIASISETEGTLEDLTPGLRVNLTGERNEEGVLQAISIRVVPEGLDLPQRGQLGGQINPEVLAGLAGLSEQERNALALQATIMAAQARGGGGVIVESPEGGVAGGPPAGALAIPGETRAFSYTAPSQDGGGAARPLTGVLGSVDGGVLELTTPRGPVRASITQETAITIFSETEGTLDDLIAGAQVIISGQPDGAGNLQATTITIIPESLAIAVGRPFGGLGTGPGAGFGGGQGGFGGGQGGGRPRAGGQ